MYVYRRNICIWVLRSGGQRVSGPLELEFQVVVSHLMWVLGTEVESSAWTFCAFNCSARSPTPSPLLSVHFNVIKYATIWMCRVPHSSIQPSTGRNLDLCRPRQTHFSCNDCLNNTVWRLLAQCLYHPEMRRSVWGCSWVLCKHYHFLIRD